MLGGYELEKKMVLDLLAGTPQQSGTDIAFRH